MAEETIKKIIDVQVEGTESLNDLIKQIDDLSKRLNELDKSSQEYKDILVILAKQQAKINASMKGQKQSTEALEGSYDSLTKQMRDLRKEWRATNDEQKRSDLGKEINDINTQLKGMDATIGNFQRNVGNYEGALRNVFKSPKQQIKELREELAQLTEGTDEYNQKLNQLSTLVREQAKLNEQLVFSSADLGDVIGNVAGVAQGLAGGFSAIQGIMALFGDDDHFGETIKNLTALMAIVQGLGALEQLRDRLKGLKDAWKAFRTSAEGTSGVMSGAGDAMKAVSGNAQGTSGALGKVSISMDGVTASVEKTTAAIQANAETFAQYGTNLDEMSMRLKRYSQVIAEGNFDAAERLKPGLIKDYGEEIVSLSEKIGKNSQNIRAYWEQYGVTMEGATEQEKQRVRTLRMENKELHNKRETLKQAIASERTLTTAVNSETKAENANNKAQEQGNKTAKESLSLMKLATGWIDKLIAERTGLTMATRAGTVANNLFMLSLKGLKAAITATGIGALVVIMGELINLLFKGVESLKGWISGTDKWNGKAKELADTLDRVNGLMDDMNYASEFQERLMEAQGKSYDEIYREKRRNIELQLAELEAVMNTNEAYQKYLTLTEKQKGKKKYEKVVEEAERLVEAHENLKKKLREIDDDKTIHDVEEQTRKAAEEAEKAGDKAKNATDKAGRGLDDLRKKIEDLRKELQKTVDEFGKTMQSLSQSKENPYEKLEREYNDRLKKADEAQKAETKLLDLDLSERLISREDYEKRLTEISGKYSKYRLELAVDEADQYRKILGQDVYSKAEKTTKESKSGFDLEEQRRKAEDEIAKLRDEIESSEPMSLWDILFKDGDSKFSERLDDMRAKYDKTIEFMNETHQRRLGMLRSTMSEWMNVANSDDIDEETRTKAQERVKETQNAINDEVTRNLKDNLDQRAAMLSEEEAMWREHAQRIVDYNQGMVSALGGMMSSLADIYEQDAENRADGDEKSQKVAKKSFKKAQSLRIAEATINTLNGAIGAFMQATATYPAPYGQILGAATSAAALASGMAQIQKIKSQTFDGSSSLSGGGITYQLPNIEQYEPSYSQNITGESDTDKLQKAVEQGMKGTSIYVRVSDINNAQKTVQVRDSESTW